jgi:5-(aminomethyl)-3-furanmethanol phosphate kinase
MIRVVKVGGSLLDWPLLPRALGRCLAQQPAVHVLIAGGGALVDVIRSADRHFALGAERSHWLSIEAMSISAQVLAAILTDCRHVVDFVALKSLVATRPGCPIVFDMRYLLHDEPPYPGRTLPHDWSVTSDSIAAQVAQLLSADELLMLKSADPPAGSLMELAGRGYVDEYFPVAAAGLAVRFVNLRSKAV